MDNNDYRNRRFLLYKSDFGEIKTLRQWIDFANRNDAMFATNSVEYKIRIVTGGILQEKIIRELTEHKFFKRKKTNKKAGL